MNEEYEKAKRLGDKPAEVDSLYGPERKNRGDGWGLKRDWSQWHFLTGGGGGKSKFSIIGSNHLVA
ncbi:MAG: hypothetical protein SBU_000663 [Candidatus Syntrophoarchaeum butanivorans]|uniref:Uncharacterized protein n=1 Tax=Candidatus Syntropharchaeum butanivorans TaxID=1839936 RepID=A0A1F2P7W0_9EURY|nr:MAG: hypothetical protein SBU_000663 [Candidatus Syntrophoarchaeum butanivorans]